MSLRGPGQGPPDSHRVTPTCAPVLPQGTHMLGVGPADKVGMHAGGARPSHHHAGAPAGLKPSVDPGWLPDENGSASRPTASAALGRKAPDPPGARACMYTKDGRSKEVIYLDEDHRHLPSPDLSKVWHISTHIGPRIDQHGSTSTPIERRSEHHSGALHCVARSWRVQGVQGAWHRHCHASCHTLCCSLDG